MLYTPLVRPTGATDQEFFALCKRTDLSQSLRFFLSVPSCDDAGLEPAARDLLARAEAELDRRPKLKQSTKKLRDEYTSLLNHWRSWRVEQYGWGSNLESEAVAA